jgi:hypothetical protein
LLARPVLGTGGVESQLILFTGVIAGSVGQWIFTWIQDGELEVKRLIAGLIASVVVFPLIFRKAGLIKEKMNFTKWCVAFQNGFFWPVVFGQVAKAYH